MDNTPQRATGWGMSQHSSGETGRVSRHNNRTRKLVWWRKPKGLPPMQSDREAAIRPSSGQMELDSAMGKELGVWSKGQGNAQMNKTHSELTWEALLLKAK